jgi:hypothetical protein
MCLNRLVLSHDMSSLCQVLPSLEVLNLTNNTMENDFIESPMFENVRILVLNNFGVTWELVNLLPITLKLLLVNAIIYKLILDYAEHVEKIKVSFSGLNGLHLMSNKFKMIMVSVSSYTSVSRCFMSCYISCPHLHLLIIQKHIIDVFGGSHLSRCQCDPF